MAYNVMKYIIIENYSSISDIAQVQSLKITCQKAQVEEQKQSTDERTHREIYKQININLYEGYLLMRW